MASSFFTRLLGSSDGSSGLTPGSNGQPQTGASDNYGRQWMRLFQGSSPVDGSNPLAVNVGTSGLPTGAATEAKQDTGNSSLSSIDTKVTGLATQTTLAAANTNLTNLNTVTGTTSDASVTTSTTATISSKLRGIIDIFTNSTLGAMVRGTIAHDAVDSGNPVKTGAYAVTATSISGLAAVADADRVNHIASNQGEHYVYLSRNIAGEDISNNQLVTVPSINALTSVQKYSRSLNTSNTAQALAVKNTSGNLFKLQAVNLSTAPLYLFLVNKASAAANGDAMYWCIYPVPAGGVASDDWRDVGHTFTTGIQIAWSSTSNTLTLANGGPISAEYA